MTAVVLGHQQESRRVFIEPMHNAWAFFPANARQRLAVKEQGIDQSTTGMTGAGMHHQARGFVDHQEGVVFVRQSATLMLRRQDGRDGEGDIQGDDVSAPDAITGRHHLPGRDPPAPSWMSRCS